MVSSIGPGLLVLVGICATDGADDAEWLAQKIVKARLFEAPSAEDADAAAGAPGKPWARSVESEGKQALFVSQFTLYGSFAKGNKPDLHRAMPRARRRRCTRRSCAAARAAVLPAGRRRRRGEGEGQGRRVRSRHASRARERRAGHDAPGQPGPQGVKKPSNVI